MKKTIRIAIILSVVALWKQDAFAYHNFFFRSANDITQGVLDPNRVSPTTFTLQGNQVQIATVAAGLQSLVSAVAATTGGFVNQGGNNSGVIFSSMTNGLIVAGTGNQNVVSSSMTIGLILAGNGNSGVVSSTMIAGNQTNLTTNGNGVTLGNVNTLSASLGDLTVNGTTATLRTIPASEYSLIVGTPGAIGTQATIVSSTEWVSILSSVGVAGLTWSTTAQAKIFFKSGVYTIVDATIPAGVEIVCGSSVVFNLSNSSKTIFSVYGIFGNNTAPCIVDAAGLPYTGNILNLKSQSKSSVILYGGESEGFRGHMVNVLSSTFTYASLDFRGFTTITYGAATYLGDNSPFHVRTSSDCVFDIRTSSFVPKITTANGVFLGSAGNTNCIFNFNSEMATLPFIGDSGGWFNSYKGILRSPVGSITSNSNYGILTIDPSDSPPTLVSSGTQITELTFKIEGTPTVNLIALRSGSPDTSGVVIDCVRAYAFGGNSVTFLNVQSNWKRTLITNTYLTGITTALNDSGQSTIKSQFYLNGIAQ